MFIPLKCTLPNFSQILTTKLPREIINSSCFLLLNIFFLTEDRISGAYFSFTFATLLIIP